jgi:glycosyltransferase involved in cell wall biosynthesis
MNEKMSGGKLTTEDRVQGNNSSSLRVAMVMRSFSESGGLELYAHRVVEGLLSLGHKVTVVHEVCDSGFSHPGLTKLKFEPAPEKAPKAVRIKHHFQAASKCVLENGPFDIVHSQHLPMSGADVVTFHNHSANRLLKVGQAWEKLLTQAKMVYSNAYKTRYSQDRILCQSRVLVFPAAVMRNDFIETYGLNERQVKPSYIVAHPGAEFPGEATANQPILPSATADQGQPPFTFLFVGKGFRKKGLDILLKACQLLNDEGITFRLLIAGLRGKPIDRLRLKSMGIEKRVTYLGFRKDMHNVYAQAQASVLPSRIEPFGMAPIQGMIFGLVPIVSKVCGVAEVLTDGEDSLILQDHLSAEELARLMKRLITEQELLRKMSQRARETAAGLTWQRTAEATMSAYQIALSERSVQK